MICEEMGDRLLGVEKMSIYQSTSQKIQCSRGEMKFQYTRHVMHIRTEYGETEFQKKQKGKEGQLHFIDIFLRVFYK